jgi:hypothetical protein
MSNPFATDTFDIKAQNKLIADTNKEKETYRLMIEAGWTPQAATNHLATMRKQLKNEEQADFDQSLKALIGLAVLLWIAYIWFTK